MRALTIVAILFLNSPPAAHASKPEKLNNPSLAEQLSYHIPHRLLNMPAPFPLEYNREVGKHIESYLRPGRHATSRMMARATLYFPIIDHYLQQYGLPEELKYVPLLESRLRPAAESNVGAAGLWQFMPATARHYGLQIDEYVDERKNPYRATEAALKMLKNLHREFGDWSLALAAYNCGPGRVRSAVRQTGCHSFWDIQHLLPRQTQQYLPNLIATIFVGRYYRDYELEPRFNRYNRQAFQVFRIQHSLQLEDIARHCGISEDKLRYFNPGYLQDYIPGTRRGHYLILPEEALPNFQKYIIKENRKGQQRYAIAVLDSHQKQGAEGV